MRHGKTAFTMVSAWTDCVASGIATATTFSVRVPQLLRGSMTLTESRRRVAEKVRAAADGVAEGSAVMARIVPKRIKRPAPHEALNDVMAVAEALARPARRRVKSNAVRLSQS